MIDWTVLDCTFNGFPAGFRNLSPKIVAAFVPSRQGCSLLGWMNTGTGTHLLSVSRVNMTWAVMSNSGFTLLHSFPNSLAHGASSSGIYLSSGFQALGYLV